MCRTSGPGVEPRFMDGSLISRKKFLTSSVLAAAAAAMPIHAEAQAAGAKAPSADITLDDLKSYEKIAGVSFSDAERKECLDDVKQALKDLEKLRAEPMNNGIEPPMIFRPLSPPEPLKAKIQAKQTPVKDLHRGSDEDVAFATARELGQMVREKKVSPVELTKLYLDRLHRYGETLLCTITITDDLALKQAKAAEDEAMRGDFRSPLHGVPYGIKDLFATKNILTTWGAAPYQHQVATFDATVVQRLERAGAVLLAKLSNGALAEGDIWFKGLTKNPWNPKEGSSGSSAGSAASTAAGLVGFSIGTETLGSITSPSNRCRVTGLRPSYGRVSRYGAMQLTYSMDKVGPICREVEDCALVFAAIAGVDPADRSVVDRPFNWKPRIDPKRLKIGYLVKPDGDLTDRKPIDADPFAQQMIKLGFTLQPIRFTPVLNGVVSLLEVESAAAFDVLTRSPEIHDLKNSFWPQSFRSHRYTPGVDYILMQKLRGELMHRFDREFADYDLVVADGLGDYLLEITNLTGHPQVIIPNGVSPKGESLSKSFIGRVYHEDVVLAVAETMQQATNLHRKRPNLAVF